MGNTTKPQKVKLFTGIILQNVSLLKPLKARLCRKFGKIDFESELLNFTYTDYYEKEMGKGLKRKFISFRKLIHPDKIAKIKNITNKIESQFRRGKKRRINLDPGYLSGAKLVLATTKDYSHRIYLRDGIHAEITLSFTRDSFRPHTWAYPDYQSKDYIAIFNQMRRIFMEQKRQ